jgi:hypothetical protein
MTGVFIRKKGKIWIETETQGRRLRDDGSRDWTEASTNQGVPRTDGNQKEGEGPVC